MTDKTKNDQDIEDLYDENVEEGHDPETADGDADALVKKASDKTSKSKGRNGDKSNSESSDLKNVKEENDDETELYDFKEDLNALVNSEATLSESFKEKAEVIFEASINAKLAKQVEMLEESYAEKIDEAIEEKTEELIENVDKFLNFVVEKFIKENEVAIEAGIRTDIAENFMEGIKSLFTESYIEVPEEKVDLVDELSESNGELEKEIDALIENQIKMAYELERFVRKEIIAEASKGMADSQIEKLSMLVENIEFEDAETFEGKVKTISESYFKNKNPNLNQLSEDGSEGNEEVVSDKMISYLNALK